VRLKFTPSARTQFLEGLEYIRQDNPTAARRFRTKVEKVLRRLEKFRILGARYRSCLIFRTGRSL